MMISKEDEEKLALVIKARRRMENVFPKSFDCGRMCGKACCSGDGEIWLLPYEKLLYEDSSDGMFSVKTYFNDDGTVTDSLICRGSCDGCREKRPFWCRIFPCFPVVESFEEGGEEFIDVRVRYDIRGTMCPLVINGEKIRRDFTERVIRAVDGLCADDGMLSYFIKCGEFFTGLEELGEKLSRND